MQETLARLNVPGGDARLEALGAWMDAHELPPIGDDINNHIHTTFSFSPYSPTAAAWMARQAGLCTAGIMDHDAIAGAPEFLKAAAMLGLGGTCGLECRVSLAGTPLDGRRINNPDQTGVAYIMLHAIPHDRITEVDRFFAPLRAFRNDRNRRMVRRINALLDGTSLSLDFDRDVLPLSEYANGGSVTERHLSSALAHLLEKAAGRSPGLCDFLESTFRRPVDDRYRRMLADPANPYFHYDLIGWIKAELVPLFYIDATDECANVRDVLALARRTGAISAYGYLGDVGDSVTGDKRAQKFEDDYLDELFDVLQDLGFQAITYMPTRNTPAQLQRVRTMIAERGLFAISGEDINQPRQSFVCGAMKGGAYGDLRESAWALIAHEREPHGLFSPEAIRKWPDLQARVAAFAEKGRQYAGV